MPSGHAARRLSGASRLRHGVAVSGWLLLFALRGWNVASAVDPTDDWPQWGGTPARNHVANSARELPETWDVASGEHVRWTAALGNVAYGNPVVAQGRVLVGTNNEAPRDPQATGDRGVLMCFAADDGSFLWQDSYPKLAAGDAQDWRLQGICSSPAVADGRAYYVTNRGQVVCADLEGFHDGENDGPTTDETLTHQQAADVIWRFDMPVTLGVQPHYMSATHPLVHAGRVYVVTSNGVGDRDAPPPAPQAPSVIALSATTGELVWQEASLTGETHRVHLNTILDGQWSSVGWGEVAAAGQNQSQLYFPGGDGWLYALNPDDGRLLWKCDCNPSAARWDPSGRGDRNYLLATPVYAAGRVFMGTGQDPEHGGGPGQLLAIDPTGSGDVTATHVTWRQGGKAFGRTLSTVAVHEGIVYAAELDGFLHAFELASGRELWQYDALAAVWGSPLVADGKVYLCDEDGDVAVLRAGPERQVLAENNLQAASYGTPVAVGRRLYLTTSDRLIVVEKSATKDAR